MTGRETLLPPAESTQATCEKCGNGNIRTRWHKGEGYGEKHCGWFTASTQHGEHLHHFCENCRYDWTAMIAGPRRSAVVTVDMGTTPLGPHFEVVRRAIDVHPNGHPCHLSLNVIQARHGEGFQLSPQSTTALRRIARAKDCNLTAALELVVHEMQIDEVPS